MSFTTIAQNHVNALYTLLSLLTALIATVVQYYHNHNAWSITLQTVQ